MSLTYRSIPPLVGHLSAFTMLRWVVLYFPNSHCTITCATIWSTSYHTTSTLLYPVSLLRLGTGWEPPIRGSEMFERFPRPNLTDFFHFFCKKHMAYPFPNITFFLGRAQNFFPPQNWPFFWVPPLFQNWGPIPKIEGPGCERILGSAAVVDNTSSYSMFWLMILILLIEPMIFHASFF